MREPERRAQLWENTHYMKTALDDLGFDTGEAASPVIPIVVGEDLTAWKMVAELHEEGVFANPVVSPATAEGRAMIRTSTTTLQLDHPLRVGPRRGGVARLASCSDTLDDVQRCHIERVLRECGGRINGAGNAAVRLGIHPNTLRFRIKKLGLVIPARRPGVPAAPSAARPG